MGIDDAIARANQAEAQKLNSQREQQELDAKKKHIVDELYKDFAKRVKQAGVQPMTVTIFQTKRTLFGEKIVEVDTGQKAWVIRRYTRDDYESYMSCFAVTEEGVGTSAKIITDRQPRVLRTSDSPVQRFHRRVRLPWEEAEKFEKDELKKVSDETSTMLAEALRELGAV